MNDPMVLQILSGSIVVMGSINVFFVQRLVRKIEESSENIREFKRDLAHLTEKVNQISDINHRLNVLEKQLAVFEYVVMSKQPQKEEG